MLSSIRRCFVARCSRKQFMTGFCFLLIVVILMRSTDSPSKRNPRLEIAPQGTVPVQHLGKTERTHDTENKTGTQTENVHSVQTLNTTGTPSRRKKSKKKSRQERSEEHSLQAVQDVTELLLASSSWGCPYLSYMPPKSKGKHFRHLAGTNMSMYSAYIDGENNVRIIAMRTEEDPRLLYCHVWYEINGQRKLVGMQASILRIHENDKLNFRFHAAFVVCKTSGNDLRGLSPLAVNVAQEKCDLTGSETIPVQLPEAMSSNFTVCVSPVTFNFSGAFQLVEMIELNKLLGADKIVFYNHSMDSVVDKILRVYETNGMVDNYVWNVPNETDIHYFGQMVALQDCLYQNRYRARYLVYQDLDEFIVPQNPFKTWSELIRHRMTHANKTGMFQVRNVFFPSDFQRPRREVAHKDWVEKFKSKVLQSSVRETHLSLHDVRSKFFVDPRRVSSVGIHTYHFSPNGTLDRVPDEEALVYHYRATDRPICPRLCETDVTVINRFGEELLSRLYVSWDDLTKRLNLNLEQLH